MEPKYNMIKLYFLKLTKKLISEHLRYFLLSQLTLYQDPHQFSTISNLHLVPFRPVIQFYYSKTVSKVKDY